MTREGWGVGDKANAEPFATAYVGSTPVALIQGQFPHSRSDNNIYARFPNGRVEGFDGHRITTRVEVEESNYLKQSDLSGDEVRKGGSCKIYFNGQIVYEFFLRDAQAALLRAHSLIGKLMEHPALKQMLDETVASGDRLRGRLVYYKDTPAVLGYYMPDQGSVVIEAAEGYKFPRPAYSFSDGGVGYEEESATSVKEDILTPHIWWWRK